jgi:hypothetical protein
MKPKISIAGLRVADVDRALAFYRDGLGFPVHNYTAGDSYVMLALEGTFLALSVESGGQDAAAGAATHRTWLSHNVASPEAVQAVFDEAIAAGATAVHAPTAAPWGGHEAAFADPDGHVWDIAYNPFTDLT